MQKVDEILLKKIDVLQHPHKGDHKIFQHKMRFKTRLKGYNIKTPDTYMFIDRHQDYDKFWSMQHELSEFVVKPNHLGNGMSVFVVHKDGEQYKELDDTVIQNPYEFFKGLSKTLLAFSSHRYKGLIMEEVVHSHPKLHTLYGGAKGIVDIRLFMICDKFAFGRLRTPTKASRYYANWGRGGAIFFVDGDGIIRDGRNLFLNHTLEHPDTGMNLLDRKVPFWKEIIEAGEATAKVFGINYHTVDLTINSDGEAVIIEGESQPGLKDITPYGTNWLCNLIDTYRKGV